MGHSSDLLLKIVIENQIFFIVFFTILILQLKALSKKNRILTGTVYIIGTFFHELSHYLVACITTFSFPKSFSVIPKTENINGKTVTTLGYVEIYKSKINIFNAFLIGMSPLSLLVVAYYVAKYFFLQMPWIEFNFYTYLIYLFLITTLIINSVPSSEDFKISKHNGSIYLWLIIIILITTYYNYTPIGG